jgi:glycosyltransferase involved in cell wall biosynthesis
MQNNSMGENLPHFSVIIPVYGCSECLQSLCDRLIITLEKISKNFEIFLINDRSPDSSWLKIKELSALDNRIKGVLFSRNYGQHYAITAGFDLAKGDYIVVMDCDLQDQPEEILNLYKKAQEGYEIVYGFSSFRGYNSIMRNFFRSIYITLYDYLAQTNYKSVNLSFFLVSRIVRDAIIQYKESARHISSIVRDVGFTIEGVEVKHLERTIGKSSYNFRKRLKLALTGLISYSPKLLKISLYVGFVFSLISIVIAGIIVYKRLYETVYYPGWASLSVLILFSTGITLFFLGILGVYIEKIFNEIKNRPLYIIEEKVNL